MANEGAPYHAHVYYSLEQRPAAEALRDRFVDLKEADELSDIRFVGRMMDRGVGPHPMPQYEVHFIKRSLALILLEIESAGLRALVHPLTNDDLADHTTLGQWIGEPVELDLSVLDPPGQNQGASRFGKSDF